MLLRRQGGFFRIKGGFRRSFCLVKRTGAGPFLKKLERVLQNPVEVTKELDTREQKRHIRL